VKRVAALVVVLLALVTACKPDDVPVPNHTDVAVDTPALVAQKKAAGIENCRPGEGSAVDGGLPSITLPCLGGGPDVNLASLRGPLVVNLWGAWCAPCREELPNVAAFADRYGDQVPVVGLDFQDVDPGNAIDLLQKKGATYPQIADPGGDVVGKKPFTGRMGVPSSIFVDADGRATVVPIEIKSVDQLVDLVKQHLGIDL
jgi:thiol-disulfide isomerase/thioredoxin